DPALAADDAAVLVALFERTEGVADLHDTAFLSPGPEGHELKNAAPEAVKLRRGNYGSPSPLSTREMAIGATFKKWPKSSFSAKKRPNGCIQRHGESLSCQPSRAHGPFGAGSLCHHPAQARPGARSRGGCAGATAATSGAPHCGPGEFRG